MRYETKDAMRADLAKIISDKAEIDRIVEAQWKPPVQPRKGDYKPKPEHATKRGSRCQNPRDAIEEGSRKLGAAIDQMLAGKTPETPDKLKWRNGIQPHQSDKSKNTVVREREAKSLRAAQERKAHVQAQIVEPGVPCFKCGAARGCKHRAPANVTTGRVNRQWDREAGYG